MRRGSFLIVLSALSCHSALHKYVPVDNPTNRRLFVAIVGSTDEVKYLDRREIALVAEPFRYVQLVLSCGFNLLEERRFWEQYYSDVSFEHYMKHRTCALSDRDWDLVNELAVSSTPEFRIYSADGRQLLSSMSAGTEDETTIAQLRQFLLTGDQR